MKLMKTKSENEWVRFLGFTNSSRSHRANERIFHFDKSQSVWICQCDKVTFFHCARYYRNVPISAQSKPGSRVGGRREGENISDFCDLILEYQCSGDFTVPLYLFISRIKNRASIETLRCAGKIHPYHRHRVIPNIET